MKAKVYDLEGKEAGEAELPCVFSTPYRPDVIKRAVLAQQSAGRQRYGTDPLAGLRSSAHYHGSRHYRFKMMNMEMSRMPRIHGKVGYMAWRGRVAPQAVKGRRAHPPKAEKIWIQKINQSEKQLAMMSALAASTDVELLKIRGHSHASPIIFTDDFENVKSTKIVYALLEKIAAAELKRAEKKKVRAGKGKMRGRRYSRKKGPLVLLAKNCPAIKACRNIPGFDATSISSMNVELLAPGTQAGRLIVTTKSTLSELQKKFEK
ncbi:MAG: 50S ribosomal protein L4 [Candidatus Aenigmarchaeota archaeon]|nr:50S ribosomal protein L4 [Candidatus Aenigmarchaeota archaeon]